MPEETFSEIERLIKKKKKNPSRIITFLAGYRRWFEILSTGCSVVWWLGHFPGSRFRWRAWLPVFHWAVESVWIFPFLGRKPDSATELLTQHTRRWQQHSVKTMGCFSAVQSTNLLPKPCDFCRNTSLVLCDVFSCRYPAERTICSCQILQSPNFLPAEIERGVNGLGLVLTALHVE